MVRTVISLESEDKTWLDRKAKDEQVSMAELIRRAVRRLREESESEARPLQQQLQETSGIWKGEDGLSFQQRMREEWADR